MKVGDYVIGTPYFVTDAGEIKGKITEISREEAGFTLYRVSGAVTFWCEKVKPDKMETLRRYFK